MIAVVALIFLIVLALFLSTCRKPLIKRKTAGAELGAKKITAPISYKATADFLSAAPIEDVIGGVETIYTFSQIPKAMKYRRVREIAKPTIHNGQLKLFLTELEFLTNHMEKHDEPAYVIYAGSAPSQKIKILADLFPRVKFVLVDPNEHYIMYPHGTQYDHPADLLYFAAKKETVFAPRHRPINYYTPEGAKVAPRAEAKPVLPDNVAEVIKETNHRFYIIEDYCTDELSKLLKPLGCLFISDIRSRDESDDSPSTLHILWNSAMMMNWLDILQPRAYMLKFRCPYSISPEEISSVLVDYEKSPYTHDALKRCRVPFIDNFTKGKFIYLKPTSIYLQAFAGATSTESRLVGTSLDTTEFDVVDYNDRFFYYNRIHRSYGWHQSHEEYLNNVVGIDRCGDCAIMCGVFDNYYKKYGLPVQTARIITRLLKTIHRSLVDRKYVHGNYYEKYVDKNDVITKTSVFIYIQTYPLIADKWRPMTIEDARRIYAVHGKLLGSPFGKRIGREYSIFAYAPPTNPIIATYLDGCDDVIRCGTDAKTIAGYWRNAAPTPVKFPQPAGVDLPADVIERCVCMKPLVTTNPYTGIIDARFNEYLQESSQFYGGAEIITIASTPLHYISTPCTYLYETECNLLNSEFDRQQIYVLLVGTLPRTIMYGLVKSAITARSCCHHIPCKPRRGEAGSDS